MPHLIFKKLLCSMCFALLKARFLPYLNFFFFLPQDTEQLLCFITGFLGKRDSVYFLSCFAVWFFTKPLASAKT